MVQTRQQQYAWKQRSEQERKLLKAYGYHWIKTDGTWQLFAPSSGEETTKYTALARDSSAFRNQSPGTILLNGRES